MGSKAAGLLKVSKVDTSTALVREPGQDDPDAHSEDLIADQVSRVFVFTAEVALQDSPGAFED